MSVEIIVFSRIKPPLLLLEARHVSIRMIKTYITDNSKIFMFFLNLFALLINHFLLKLNKSSSLLILMLLI